MKTLIFASLFTILASCSHGGHRAPNSEALGSSCRSSEDYRKIFKYSKHNDLEHRRVRLNFTKTPLVVNYGKTGTQARFVENSSVKSFWNGRGHRSWFCELERPPEGEARKVLINIGTETPLYVEDVKLLKPRAPFDRDHFSVHLESVPLRGGGTYKPVLQCHYKRYGNRGNEQDMFFGRRSAADVLTALDQMFGVCVRSEDTQPEAPPAEEANSAG